MDTGKARRQPVSRYPVSLPAHRAAGGSAHVTQWRSVYDSSCGRLGHQSVVSSPVKAAGKDTPNKHAVWPLSQRHRRRQSAQCPRTAQVLLSLPSLNRQGASPPRGPRRSCPRAGPSSGSRPRACPFEHHLAQRLPAGFCSPLTGTVTAKAPEPGGRLQPHALGPPDRPSSSYRAPVVSPSHLALPTHPPPPLPLRTLPTSFLLPKP